MARDFSAIHAGPEADEALKGARPIRLLAYRPNAVVFLMETAWGERFRLTLSAPTVPVKVMNNEFSINPPIVYGFTNASQEDTDS